MHNFRDDERGARPHEGWVLVGAMLLLSGCPDDAVGGGGTASGTGTSTGASTVDLTGPGPDSTGPVATGDGSAGSSSSSGPGGLDSTSSGGDSTTGPICNDLDDDGVTDCDGDCDDDDPTSYPGATEICGDGADNDCDADPDPVAMCMGLGTYVSTLTGDDVLGDGTQANPVRTIAAGIANAITIGGGADVYVAQGNYPEKVTMVEDIDLLGGHRCNAGLCDWARDPSQFTATILNVDFEGVVAPDTVTRATAIDGFDIVAPDGNPGGGGRISAMFVAGGTPTISNNHFFGGLVNCSNCGTDGITVLGPSNDPAGVLITGNVIEAGDSVGTNFSNSTGIRLIDFANRPVVEIVGNTIFGGTARWTRAINAFNSAPGTQILDNDIHAGSQFGGDSFTSSFGMIISGDLVVDGNRINTVPGLVGSCSSAVFWCGGIESEGATATITNNVIHGMTAPRSAAIFLSDGEVPFGEIVVDSNTLDGGNSLGVAGGISAALGCRTSSGTNAMVGRIRNNILDGGNAVNRFGMYEDNQAGSRTCEPQFYENNDIWFPPSVASVDNAHRQWQPGGPQNLLPTVTEVNMQAYATGNFTDDPLLDATWHLAPASPCIDAGVPTESPPVDFEGDARPQGAEVDVGADEAL